MKTLKSPYPFTGAKSAILPSIWERIGPVDNLVIPFLGSGADVLCCPFDVPIITVGDRSCFISNFWRSIKAEPEAVAYWASDPVSEPDLHASHLFLKGIPEALPEPLVPPEYARHPLTRRAYLAGYARQDGSYGQAFRRRMKTDPDYYDVKIAGLWVKGACAWIGTGWCEEDFEEEDGSETVKRPSEQLPMIGESWRQNTIAPECSRIGARKLSQKVPRLTNDVRLISGGQPSQQVPTRPGPGYGINGANVSQQVPRGAAEGQGINRPSEKLPLLTGGTIGPGVHKGYYAPPQGRPQLADAYSRGRGIHGNDSAGTCQQRLDWITGWFRELADRFRTVRVCCGDWTTTVEAWRRVCDSESTTTRLGCTAIIIDPPYRTHSRDGKKSRAGGAYSRNDRRPYTDRINDDVLAWCVAHGNEPEMRVAVCCYSGDGYELLQREHGWDVMEWTSRGGYGNRSEEGRANRARERVFLSQQCKSYEEVKAPLLMGLKD